MVAALADLTEDSPNDAPARAVIVDLLGGVALLLWGVRMVRTGIMRAWGDRLKRFIRAAALQPRLGFRWQARWRRHLSAAARPWR